MIGSLAPPHSRSLALQRHDRAMRVSFPPFPRQLGRHHLSPKQAMQLGAVLLAQTLHCIFLLPWPVLNPGPSRSIRADGQIRTKLPSSAPLSHRWCASKAPTLMRNRRSARPAGVDSPIANTKLDAGRTSLHPPRWLYPCAVRDPGASQPLPSSLHIPGAVPHFPHHMAWPHGRQPFSLR
jgi:hypothetical protein